MEGITIEELAIIERRKYFRAWRAANKEKTAQHRRTYWLKKAEQMKQMEQEGKHERDTDHE